MILHIPKIPAAVSTRDSQGLSNPKINAPCGHYKINGSTVYLQRAYVRPSCSLQKLPVWNKDIALKAANTFFGELQPTGWNLCNRELVGAIIENSAPLWEYRFEHVRTGPLQDCLSPEIQFVLCDPWQLAFVKHPIVRQITFQQVIHFSQAIIPTFLPTGYVLAICLSHCSVPFLVQGFVWKRATRESPRFALFRGRHDVYAFGDAHHVF